MASIRIFSGRPRPLSRQHVERLVRRQLALQGRYLVKTRPSWGGRTRYMVVDAGLVYPNLADLAESCGAIPAGQTIAID